MNRANIGLGFVVGLCLLACSSSKPYGPISGTLIVHTGLVTSTGSNPASAYVLLGDGTKFNLPVDAKGDAVFHDESLQGPQTVSTVYVSGGATRVSTIVDIDRSEVWFRPSSLSPATVDAGVISGTTSGFDAGSGENVAVMAVSPYSGVAKVESDGSYSFLLSAPSGETPLTLLAIDTPPSSGLGGVNPTRVGMAIDVASAQRLSPPPIALDHPLDQTLSVSAHDAQGPRSDVFASLFYFLRGNALFAVSGANPGAVPNITPTPPFDQTTIELNVNIGDASSLPDGEFELWSSQPATDLGASIDVPVPEPLKLTSPVLTASGPQIRVADFKLSWEPSTVWKRVSFYVRQPQLSWSIDAPADVGKFEFFPLPSNVSPNAGFSATDVTFSYRASGGEVVGAVEDSYGPEESTPPLVPGSPVFGQGMVEAVDGVVHLD